MGQFGDLHLGKRLAVARVAVIAGLRLVLHDLDLRRAAMGHDFAGNLGTHERGTDGHTLRLFIRDEQGVKRHRSADVGMAVVDEAGHDLGLIETIWDLPGHQVFVVKQEGREVLIPAAKDFVTAVDLAQKRMTVRMIEGLVESSYAL